MDSDSELRFTLWSGAQAPRLHRLAYLLCGDWHEAEDRVQDALAKAALHWRRIERVEHPDAYVRAVLVNECRTSWRRRSGRALASESVDEVVADSTDAVIGRADVMQVLGRLPARQRATVVLRYYEDLSEAETANVLGCSVGTVKSQLHKAMRTLQQTMTKEGLQC